MESLAIILINSLMMTVNLSTRFVGIPGSPSSNMRGAGESIFEFEFLPGSEMVSEILRDPKARRE